MGWPADTLAGIYLFLFAFGFVFSIASLLLGAGHDHIHLPGHGHIGHGHTGSHVHVGHGPGPHAHAGHGPAPAAHGHGPDSGQAHGEGEARVGNPAPINLSTVMVFLTWFGAAGYVLRAYYGAATGVSLLAACAAGAAGAALIYLFMAKVLWRGQTRPLDLADYIREGTPARVTQPIRAGGTGEIIYTLDNKRLVDGARCVDGSPIPVGAEVSIVCYEGGLAYVEPAERLHEGGPFQGRPVEPTPESAARRSR